MIVFVKPLVDQRLFNKGKRISGEHPSEKFQRLSEQQTLIKQTHLGKDITSNNHRRSGDEEVYEKVSADLFQQATVLVARRIVDTLPSLTDVARGRRCDLVFEND